MRTAKWPFRCIVTPACLTNTKPSASSCCCQEELGSRKLKADAWAERLPQRAPIGPIGKIVNRKIAFLTQFAIVHLSENPLHFRFYFSNRFRSWACESRRSQGSPRFIFDSRYSPKSDFRPMLGRGFLENDGLIWLGLIPHPSGWVC